MKAIECTKYGPPSVLKICEVEKPVPKDDEVCIRVFATAVTASDVFIRSGRVSIPLWVPFRLAMGITKPRQPILGIVFAGKIESVGKNIRRFKTDDQVYGLSGFKLGCYAEFMCMKEVDSKNGCISIKPSALSYEEATSVAYGGLLALQRVEAANIKRGNKVLIYGASGTTGTIAVQLAKYYGAEVTGICSTSNVEFVKSLGADNVIDYTRINYPNQSCKFDFILDAVGKKKKSLLKEACRSLLTDKGRYVSIDDGDLELQSDRLDTLKELCDSGEIRAIIDRVYPFEQIVAAHEYVSAGHKVGGVAITV